jgi:hypothetical protein
MIKVWREAFQNRKFSIELILSVVFILAVVLYLPHYFHSIIGPRKGINLNDPILNLFLPKDYSWMIFGLIYWATILSLQGLISRPHDVLLGLKCYLLITLLRMASMYILTLEPPEGIIPLTDPIVERIAYGGTGFNKDLFFSGHVATLSLFVFLEKRKWIRILLIGITMLVALFILMQRVHFAIDIIASPVIVFGVFLLMKRIRY